MPFLSSKDALLKFTSAVAIVTLTLTLTLPQ